MVTPEEKEEMARILRAMSGEAPSPRPSRVSLSENSNLSPGASSHDTQAMKEVLSKFNNISNLVVNDMLTEGVRSPEVNEALNTQRTQEGVKIGRYQIHIKEDQSRVAGKQYFSIYNSLTNDVIADDISLYETALGAVRMLNSGRFANSKEVMNLFEQDAQYTSHKIDATMFRRKMLSSKDASKKDIYESRYQASLDRCMAVKKTIKSSVK